ncbi:MAG TPA: GTPase RsgA, partial [Acidimicrobiales bacterium]|nr:GTPase RsgA [Acidimicrobiales bacterium]
MTENSSALWPFGFTERVQALWNDRETVLAEPGRVVRIDGGSVRVACADGTERAARCRSRAAVGDWVALEGDVVAEVLPRWSVIARADPAANGVQMLAANVDIMVVAAPADRLKVARVEREVALAWESGVRPLVMLTKSDLDDTRLLDSLRARLDGVEVISTSAYRRSGLVEFAAEFAPGRTGLLIGPSGAGKSTLVNALIGRDAQATGAVRTGDHRGRHTTTARQLLCLPGGGVLIDSPGLRSLGLDTLAAPSPTSTGSHGHAGSETAATDVSPDVPCGARSRTARSRPRASRASRSSREKSRRSAGAPTHSRRALRADSG